MMAKSPDIKAYMEAFERAKADLPGAGQPWAEDIRAEAMQAFADLGLPNARLEDWKYTPANFLKNAGYAALSPDTDITLEAEKQAGLHILSLKEAVEHQPERIQTLFEQKTGGDALFHLNRAMASDGLVIRVDKGCRIAQPVTIRHRASGSGETASHIHHLILLEENSGLTVIEEFTGDAGASWTNPAVMIEIAEGASLQHYKHQNAGPSAVHTAQASARIASDGRYDRFAYFTGAATARDDVRVYLEGKGAYLSLKGLSLCDKDQSHDLITRTDHAVPNTASDQAFRGVLEAGAKAAFQGKVVVRKNAQKTDANQSFKNLLLDRSAEVNTKPELEIYADDVKCAHGATVGELDKNALFYLMARGIAPPEAQAMLIEAFITDQFAAIEDETVRDNFMAHARTWMGRKDGT